MSVAKSSFLFATGTLFSRVIGLVRESVLAGVFGATSLLDAFFLANRIPNLLRETLAEGALGASFTKVFSSLWEQDQKRAEKILIDSLWLTGIIVSIITLLGILAAPWLVQLLTLFANQEDFGDVFIHNATQLTRVLFPFILLMAIGAIATGALHQRGRFFLTAISPILLNLGYIFGALVLSKMSADIIPIEWEKWLADRRVLGLAIGVLLGGAGQAGIQLWGLWKPLLKDKIKMPSLTIWNEHTKQIFLLMVPMVIASSAGQINMVVNTNFATSLESGAVSWLTFSFRILQLPIGLFGVAVGAAVLPVLSRTIARTGDHRHVDVGREIQNAVDLVLWLMMPCFIFIAFSSREVISLLFEHGAFDQKASQETAAALYYYSFGLFGYGLIKVLTSYYYARGRTNYAMYVSLSGILVNFLLNYFLVETYGHTGIALTASLVLSSNALFLGLGLFPDRPRLNLAKLLKSITILCIAGVLSALLLMFVLPQFEEALLLTDLTYKLKSALLICLKGGSIAIVFIALGLIRLRKTPKDALSLLRRR